jgi:hypothetical protein
MVEEAPKWQRARVLGTNLYVWVKMGTPVENTGYHIYFHAGSQRFINSYQIVTREGYQTNIFDETTGPLALWKDEAELQGELRWDDPPMVSMEDFAKQLSTDLN